MISKKQAAAATLLAFGTSVSSGSTSVAAPRTLTGAIEFGVLTSDNPTLVEDNQLRGLAASVNPSLELKIESKNFDSRILGELQFLHFDDPEQADIIDPRLFAKSVGTLIPNLAYLDTSLSIAKVTTDEEIFRLSEDSDPTLQWLFKPFIEHSFGTIADLIVRYEHQVINQSVDDSAESIQNALSFSLTRDPTQGGFVWGVGGSTSLDEGGNGRVENTTLYGEVGLTLAQIYLITARAGAERNDFANIDDDDRESELWNVDLTWTPSERTTLTAGYESRFFSRGPTLLAEHKSRNSILTASWTRGISRTRAVLGDLSLFGDEVTTLPVEDLATDTSALTEPEPFVDTQLRLSYKLTGRRSDLVVDAVYATQDQINGAGEIERRIGRVAFDRRLSPTTTLRLAYNYLDSGSNTEQAGLDYVENRLGAYLKFKLR